MPKLKKVFNFKRNKRNGTDTGGNYIALNHNGSHDIQVDYDVYQNDNGEHDEHDDIPMNQPIPSGHKDRMRPRKIVKTIKDRFQRPTNRNGINTEREPFVDMQTISSVDKNFGPLVRISLLPKEQPIGRQPIGTMTNFVLCCKMHQLVKDKNYEVIFSLLKRNDRTTKRAAVDCLQTVLLLADPSRKLDFDKKTFFQEGLSIVFDEMVRSIGDRYTLGILFPLAYSIISLMNLCVCNGQISGKMKGDIHVICKKRLEKIQQSPQFIEEMSVLQEMIQDLLELRINAIFLVVDWVSYFRDEDVRNEFVSSFFNLRTRDRISSIFLLCNLTLRRENRDNTIWLICHILNHLAEEVGLNKLFRETTEAKYIMVLISHIFLNEPTPRTTRMSSQCLQILKYLSQHYRGAQLSREVQSRFIFNPNEKVRKWVFENQHLFTINLEVATDKFITFCARKLQLNIDLDNDVSGEISPKGKPYWKSKTCQCLCLRAKIHILYPSKHCLQQGVTYDYKESVEEKIVNKWHVNELDCLIRLHNREGHRNVTSLLCFQCIPMPLFYVVEDNDSINLLEFLACKKEEKGRLDMHCLLEICLQATEAIKFVHGKGIVHRDITADSFRCFMQGGKICVSLSAFRMASLLWDEGETPSRTKIDIECDMIPIRWSAPESLTRGEFSFYSDIWMLGIFMFEIFNHGVWPYTEVHLDNDISTDNLMEKIVFVGLRPSSGYVPVPVHNIIKKCLDGSSPDNRCSLKQIIQEIKEFIGKHQNKMIYDNIQDSWDYFVPNKKRLPISERQRSFHLKPERKIPSSLLSSRQFNNPEDKFYEQKGLDMTEKRVANIVITDVDIHTYSEPERTRDKTVTPPVLFVKENVADTFMNNASHSLKEDTILLGLTEEPCLSKDEKEGYQLTYQCVDGVSLYQFVTDRYLGEDFDKYLDIVFKIALTVRSLHNKSWIIRCLRPQDIWISLAEHKVYIPRLGVFRKLPQEGKHTDHLKEVLTTDRDLLYWSAPEVINEGLISKAGDIWSFAMTVSQMCCILGIEEDHYEDEGYIELRSTPFSYVHESQLYRHLTDVNMPDRFPCCPEWLYQLLTECWEVERSERPNIESVIRRFLDEKTSLREIAENPQENTASSSSSSYDYAEGCGSNQSSDYSYPSINKPLIMK